MNADDLMNQYDTLLCYYGVKNISILNVIGADIVFKVYSPLTVTLNRLSLKYNRLYTPEGNRQLQQSYSGLRCKPFDVRIVCKDHKSKTKGRDTKCSRVIRYEVIKNDTEPLVFDLTGNRLKIVKIPK